MFCFTVRRRGGNVRDAMVGGQFYFLGILYSVIINDTCAVSHDVFHLEMIILMYFTHISYFYREFNDLWKHFLFLHATVLMFKHVTTELVGNYEINNGPLPTQLHA